MQVQIPYANILTVVVQFKKIVFTLRDNILFSVALSGSDLDVIDILSLTRVAAGHISSAFR